MNDIETKNARIESTMLGVEDHGIFTFVLYLDYGGGGQGAGTYALDKYDRSLDKRVGAPFGIDLIMRIMSVVGVSSWEDLRGKHVRVKASWDKVHAIGNFLRNDWLDFQEFFDAQKEKEK